MSLVTTRAPYRKKWERSSTETTSYYDCLKRWVFIVRCLNTSRDETLISCCKALNRSDIDKWSTTIYGLIVLSNQRENQIYMQFLTQHYQLLSFLIDLRLISSFNSCGVCDLEQTPI